MDQYNLFELAVILLFGLAGGLLCAAACVVLFVVETYPLLRELLL